MYIRQAGEWVLHMNAIPSGAACPLRDALGTCDCAYHLVNTGTMATTPFDDWKTAEAFFIARTGASPLTAENH